MEGNTKQAKSGGVTRAYNLVPAGAAALQRRYVATRFPVGPPGFSNGGEFALGVDQQQAAATSKQRDSAPAAAAATPALLLTNKSLPGMAPNRQFQGVPRTDAIGNYFVLMKAGRDYFSVYPLEASYTFKPYVKPSGLTIEEVEAGQRAPAAAAAAASAGSKPSLLLPKSVRMAMREQQATQAADKQLHEDAAPLLKDKLAELAVKYGSSGGSSGSRLVLHASDGEDGGSSDMDFGGEDDGDAPTKRRGPKAAAGAAAGKGKKGKGAAGSAAAAADIGDDELAEDIYAGEEDELRPERPDKAADWEFVEDAQDDDLGMGGSDEEELEDDPGLRKELGIEEEEEEEENAEQKEAELDKAAAEAAETAAAAAGKAAEGVVGEDDMPGDAAGDDEDDDDAVLEVDDDDDDYLDRLAEAADEDADGIPPQGFKRRKQAAPNNAGRYRSPAPAQRGATPPAAAAAAAGRNGTPGAGKRAATPPSVAVAAALAAQGGGRSATPPPAGRRRTPPPAAAAAAAGAGRRPTPPPQQQLGSTAGGAKRKREIAGGSEGGALGSAGAPSGPAAAAAAAAAGAGGQPAWNWARHQLDAQGVPTTDGIIEALKAMGPIPTERLGLLQEHLVLGAEGKALLKKRLLQVAKVDKVQGRKYMVLKSPVTAA